MSSEIDRALYRNRAGTYVSQPTGYKAFIPKSLPPEPPINMDAVLISILSKADRAIGRLDGAAELLPNPDLFVAMYVKKEAVLSSQIEGTQASLIDVLEYEAEDYKTGGSRDDVGEIVNYIAAMNYGLDRLEDLPLSLRLIREIHELLLMGTRGSEWEPGEFRRSQNWIGPRGCTLATAKFVPPPPHEMQIALGELENYFYEEDGNLPVLIKCGLIHAQFETIHPFVDGNGRIGRLLITFLLCQQEILKRPLLYLSFYLKRNRTEYYDRLQDIRDKGDWEGWLKFFLEGVWEVSRQATETARRITALQNEHRELIIRTGSSVDNSLKLLDKLYRNPVITSADVVKTLGVSMPTANSLIKRFLDAGILVETSGQQRYRRYKYKEYVDILMEGTTGPIDDEE